MCSGGKSTHGRWFPTAMRLWQQLGQAALGKQSASVGWEAGKMEEPCLTHWCLPEGRA